MTYHRFSPFQSHLELAHHYWQKIVQPGDQIIDATCGNGHDTLLLATFALQPEAGHLWAIDLQKQALEKSQKLLSTELSSDLYQRISWMHQSHAQFPSSIEKESVKLIVYNLGYLPGGNKEVTTQTASTLQSLEQALALLCPGGAISLTCYPGHPEGAAEEKAIRSFLEHLDPRLWCVCHHVICNRQKAPSLFLIMKGCSVLEATTKT